VKLAAGSLYTSAEVVVQFSLTMAGELPSKEYGNLISFHAVYGRFGDGIIRLNLPEIR